MNDQKRRNEVWLNEEWSQAEMETDQARKTDWILMKSMNEGRLKAEWMIASSAWLTNN